MGGSAVWERVMGRVLFACKVAGFASGLFAVAAILSFARGDWQNAIFAGSASLGLLFFPGTNGGD